MNKDLATPNGIGISNDQSTLYISDTGTNSLYTLDLTSFQGEPIAAEKLVELLPIEGGGEGHGPDGLRVATDGSIWAVARVESMSSKAMALYLVPFLPESCG